MIREVEYDSYGNVTGYVTYGTATDTNDETSARVDKVLGKYVFSIPKIGGFFNFVNTPAGYLSCIFAPFVDLICWYGLKIMRILNEM